MIDHVVFELQTDKQTGFKTRSILCMPIRNAQGRVIGVSQLVNKKDRTPFNKNDENLFEVSIIIIHHECEGGIEKPVPKITVWHHKTSRVMTSLILREGFFYSTLTQMDSFSCSSLFL